MSDCEHIIGMLNDYANTDIVTLQELKLHIENMKRYRMRFAARFYTLEQYADKRINTDLTQFDYCPMCGEKIDWKAIKRGKG